MVTVVVPVKSYNIQGAGMYTYNQSFVPISRGLYDKFVNQGRIRNGQNLLDGCIRISSIVNTDKECFFLIGNDYTDLDEIYYDFFESWYNYVFKVYIDAVVNDENIKIVKDNNYYFVNDKYRMMRNNLDMNQKIIDNAKNILLIMYIAFGVTVLINLLINIFGLKKESKLLRMYKLNHYMTRYRYILGYISCFVILVVLLTILNFVLNAQLRNSYTYVNASIIGLYNIPISLSLFACFAFIDFITIYLTSRRLRK